MQHPTKRRVGRLRALTLAAALLVSVFAAAIPASAAPGNGNGKAVGAPEAGGLSWVWTGSNELVQPKSWVWTGSAGDNDELVSPQSWVWTGG